MAWRVIGGSGGLTKLPNEGALRWKVRAFTIVVMCTSLYGWSIKNK
jgi:hypothetical protein